MIPWHQILSTNHNRSLFTRDTKQLFNHDYWLQEMYHICKFQDASRCHWCEKKRQITHRITRVEFFLHVSHHLEVFGCSVRKKEKKNTKTSYELIDLRAFIPVFIHLFLLRVKAGQSLSQHAIWLKAGQHLEQTCENFKKSHVWLACRYFDYYCLHICGAWKCTKQEENANNIKSLRP